MDRQVTPRQVALLLWFLKKEVLRPRRRSKISDRELAERLNEALVGAEEPLILHKDKIGALLKGKRLKTNDQEKLVQAIEKLARAGGHPISAADPPAWLEERYGRELSDEFKPGSVLEGDDFGPYARTLPGPWLLFYVRPIDDEGEKSPEIRCILVVFGNANRESTSATCLHLSRHYQWNGHAFIRGSHLYITGGDEKDTESYFFVVNAPLKKDDYRFAGVGALLLQPPRHHQPVAGVVCFGEPLRSVDSLDASQQKAIAIAKNQGQISAGDQAILRRVVRSPIYKDKESLRIDYPDLCEYMEKSILINGLEHFPLHSLFLSWR